MVGTALCAFAHPNHGLLRFARNADLRPRVRQINATGKSPKSLSSPPAKNIPLNTSGKSAA